MSMKDTVRLLTYAQNYTLFSKQVIKTVPQNLVLIPAFSEHHLMSTEDNQKFIIWSGFAKLALVLYISSSSFGVSYQGKE